MDLTELSDEELDALQLAVNTEIGVRLQKSRAVQRLAAVLDAAAVDGYSREDIDAAVEEAKSIAKLPERKPVYATAPVTPVTPDPTFVSKRTATGFRATTISVTPSESPGDINGAG